MCNKIVFAIFLQIYVALAGVPSYDGTRAIHRRQQYHPNMTSMLMMNSRGQMTEMFLTDRYGTADMETNGDVRGRVFFYLYTREYNDAYPLYINDIDTLMSSTFDPSRLTKVLIHGFDDNFLSAAEQIINEAYISNRDVNIIAVDWGALAKAPNYFSAVSYVQPVGQQVGLLIDFLVSAGADVSSFHIIGHSLGAHVSSFAANSVISGRITRITGLDPALPLFWDRPINRRLDPSDAEVVDCIHTCGGLLGFYTPLCTHDFYPNGGKPSQPGCGWDVVGACSHGRSYRLFAASISVNFTAIECNSTQELKELKCSGGNTGLMGDPAEFSKPGMYYMKTDKSYPYVKS